MEISTEAVRDAQVRPYQFFLKHLIQNFDLSHYINWIYQVQLKEHQSQLPVGSLDLISSGDSFSKVLGKNLPGRVRMFGLGPSPSDIFTSMPSASTCYRIVKENAAAIKGFEESVAEQNEKPNEQALQLADLRRMYEHQNK